MYQNRSLRERVLHQFFPTVLESITLVVLSSMLLAYSTYQAFRDSEGLAWFGDFSENWFSSITMQIADFISGTVITASVGTMILWAAVGAIVYPILLLLFDLLRGAEGTLKSAFLYSHPKGFDSSNYVVSSFISWALHAIGVFTLFLYSFVFMNTLVPLLHQGIERSIRAFSAGTLWIMLYIALFMIAVHVWVIMLRLVRARHLHDDAELF